MSFPERQPKGQKEGSVHEDITGRGGIGFWPCGDIQHELSPGSAICRGSPGDDAEDSGVGAKPSKEKFGMQNAECGIKIPKSAI